MKIEAYKTGEGRNLYLMIGNETRKQKVGVCGGGIKPSLIHPFNNYFIEVPLVLDFA